MNQTLTTPHCLWLGFINQHLHYDSELDSIADIHNRCYNSISVHFSLFIIKTKHIQNSPRLSLYHSYILSHLDSSYSATIIVSSSSILFCNVLNLLYSKLPYWTAHTPICLLQYIYIFQSIPILSIHYRNGYGLFIFHLIANEKQLIGLECWSIQNDSHSMNIIDSQKSLTEKKFKSFECPICLTLFIPRIVIIESILC